jgi:hypothetical protein
VVKEQIADAGIAETSVIINKSDFDIFTKVLDIISHGTFLQKLVAHQLQILQT